MNNTILHHFGIYAEIIVVRLGVFTYSEGCWGGSRVAV